jgi:hypothetical protein
VVAAGGVILAVLAACSSEPPPAGAPATKLDQLVSVDPTPAFRNLGKRGESKL